jgi:hypothetical protein
MLHLLQRFLRLLVAHPPQCAAITRAPWRRPTLTLVFRSRTPSCHTARRLWVLQALFGDSLNADGNGSLTFLDYLRAVNKRMPGRAAAATAGKAEAFSGKGAAASRRPAGKP